MGRLGAAFADEAELRPGHERRVRSLYPRVSTSYSSCEFADAAASAALRYLTPWPKLCTGSHQDCADRRCMVAEIIHHFAPEIVDLHNYSESLSAA